MVVVVVVVMVVLVAVMLVLVVTVLLVIVFHQARFGGRGRSRGPLQTPSLIPSKSHLPTFSKHRWKVLSLMRRRCRRILAVYAGEEAWALLVSACSVSKPS